MPSFMLVSGSACAAAILIACYATMDGSGKSNTYILVTENFFICYCVCVFMELSSILARPYKHN